MMLKYIVALRRILHCKCCTEENDHVQFLNRYVYYFSFLPSCRYNKEKKGQEGSLYTKYNHINLKITVPHHKPFNSFTSALLKISISQLTFQHFLSFAVILKASLPLHSFDIISSNRFEIRFIILIQITEVIV